MNTVRIKALFAALLTIVMFENAMGDTGFETPPDPAEWRLVGSNPEEQHYSNLHQIDNSNVQALGIAWYADMPTPDGMMGTPLVVGGIVYQSGSHSIIYANDLLTGKLLWSYDPQVNRNGTFLTASGALINRGLAVWDDLAIVATGDCRLVAVDRQSGTKRWEVQACDADGQTMITGAPRIAANKVFIGNANGDLGTRRGHVDAFDARTGKHLWRFYTVPRNPALGSEGAALDKAVKTWGDEWWKKTGGGSVWESMNYDPTLNFLFLGVGGPSPFNPNARGQHRGAELFTNSIVALNADTGQYVWHYQTTPDDAWNLEPVMHMLTADITFEGRKRHVLMQAPKNGFFYVLDAATGQLLSANHFVPVSWASRIDLKSGLPIESASARYYDHPERSVVVSPGPYGAHSWQPMSYSRQTGLVYIPAMDMKARWQLVKEAGVLGGTVRFDIFEDLKNDRGLLIGWDPLTQRERWHVVLPSIWNGGVLSTAGNLVFQGTATGEFRAYQANTGRLLWSKQLGSGISGAPSTVFVKASQYILLPIGSGAAAIAARTLAKLAPVDQPLGPSRLVAFKLNGSAELPSNHATVAPFEKPELPRPNSTLAAKGEHLFEASGCDVCHGMEAIAIPNGSVPDLRRLPPAIHAMFSDIVLNGALSSAGMPSFKDSLTQDDVAAIQAYVIGRAWESYESQKLPLNAN